MESKTVDLNAGKVDIGTTDMEAYDKLSIGEKENRLKAALALSEQSESLSVCLSTEL